MRSAMEWAQVKTVAADGVSQREIAARLGINRRTVKGLVEADEPPRYRRAPTGSMLDALDVVIREPMDEWPDIKGAGDRRAARRLRLHGFGRSGQGAHGGATAEV